MTIEQIYAKARELADVHGLQNVPIELDNSRRMLGRCFSRGTVITRLSFSRVLLPLLPDSEVIDTILHEIAHALTPGSHHGIMWQLKAREIGARPQSCSTVAIDARLVYKYVATCACGPVHGKTREPKALRRCATCKTALTYVQQY